MRTGRVSEKASRRVVSKRTTMVNRVRERESLVGRAAKKDSGIKR